MAIQHQFTVLCEYVMQDATGNCTFAGTYTSFYFVGFPVYRRIGIGVGFDGSTEGGITITVNDPDGEVLASAVLSRNKNQRPAVHEFDFELNTIAFSPVVDFTKEGIHHIVLNEDGQVVHKRPFGVFLRPLVEGENTKSNAGV